MSTKRPPVRTDDAPLHPVAAVLLILAVCLVAWAVICAVAVVTLVVAGSVGLVLLVTAVGAVWWGVRS